jgi:uncharacterized protein YecA (UPF0149 family)
MQASTGEIFRGTEEYITGLEADLGEKLIPLTEEEDKVLSAKPKNKRKNWMRNKPCVCGSGRKFKRCCWGKYG